MIINPDELKRSKNDEEQLVSIMVQYIEDITGLLGGEGGCDVSNAGDTTQKETVNQ